MSLPSIDSIIRVSLGEIHQDYSVNQIDQRGIFVSSIDNPNHTSLLINVNNKWQVYGTNIMYQIEFIDTRNICIDNPLYAEILQKAQENLDKFRIRLESLGERTTGKDPSKLCQWCVLGKREDFTESDLTTACSWWCKFAMGGKVKHPGSTGFEPELAGEFFDQIRQLNDYILTTASTNRPEDPTAQAMFLVFYTTRDIANKLYDYINTLDQYYLCLYFDNKTKELKYRNNIKFKDYNSPEDMSDYFGDYGMELNNFVENELTFMVIEDTFQERRTLYLVLINFLKSICYHPLNTS